MRFFVTTSKTSRMPEEQLNVKDEGGARLLLWWLRRHRMRQSTVDNMLSYVREYSRPGDPDPWQILMDLFPGDRQLLEGYMLADLQRRLLDAAKGVGDTDDPPF